MEGWWGSPCEARPENSSNEYFFGERKCVKLMIRRLEEWRMYGLSMGGHLA